MQVLTFLFEVLNRGVILYHILFVVNDNFFTVGNDFFEPLGVKAPGVELAEKVLGLFHFLVKSVSVYFADIYWAAVAVWNGNLKFHG